MIDRPKKLAPITAVFAAGLFLVGCSASLRNPRADTDATAFFIGVTNFGGFHPIEGTGNPAITLLSPELAAPFPFDELIASWNAVAPIGSGIKIEARALDGARSTQFYTLGLWAADTAQRPRESVTGQRDEDGDVKTDTLVLKHPATRALLQVTLFANEQGAMPELKFLGLGFSRPSSMRSETKTEVAGARRRLLPVPERAQLAYPDGAEWCSPTCVSMVLAYWANVLNSPKLNLDVPQVAAGVFDRNWPGTGNWVFNTAFAGQLTGMRAFVTRLRDISELEELVAAGVPPIVSVSFDWLNGKTLDHGSGHLVVCVGFNERGEVVLNDPWAFGEKAGTVQRTVSRHDLRKAWACSRNTVYLIYPETWPLPKSRWSHW